MKKEIAIYCLDQDRHKNASLGIFNYTRNFIRAISKLPDPGITIKLWVSSENASCLLPGQIPAWMSYKIIKGNFASGIKRLCADHLIAPLLELREQPLAVHYPKGWLPCLSFTKTIRIATIHDTIVHFLAKQYPGYRSILKNKYFIYASIYSIKKSKLIFVDSLFTANEIKAINPHTSNKIFILPLGPGLPIPQNIPTTHKEQILVIGSKIPYKATAETLLLLSNYCLKKGKRLKVTVTSLDKWQKEWGIQPPVFDIKFTGYLNDEDLIKEYTKSKVLVFLSEIEGFGMPAIESYLCHTPVCFRKKTAVEEILQDAPGGWDGKNLESFSAALDEVMEMSAENIKRIKENIAIKYNWENCAKTTIELYKRIVNA